ncbi:MAG: hypothetical protein JXJ04_02890 [Spirochaetales bacterium]|nr:hypothetical protein [Spirochaetales bacterium]
MEVKGSVVKAIPEFIKNKFGEKECTDWIDSLSIEAKEVYSYMVIPSNWYPLQGILTEPLKKLCELFYNGNLKGAYEAGRYSAEIGLKGIYKAFIQLGSPQLVIKKSGSILPTFYRPSNIEISKNEKGKAILSITEFSEMDPIVEQRIIGWMDMALEICGCKNIHLQLTKSLTKGDSVSEITITYE